MTSTIHLLPSLDPQTTRSVREIMDAAFEGDFSDDDWDHALGGTHAVAREAGDAGRIVGHASVVPRELWVDDRRLACGYVEAVAVAPERQQTGIGTELMRTLASVCGNYDLCVLGTGEYHFYERLGWERWQGTTWVRTADGLVHTAEDDDCIMILRTPRTPDLALAGRLVCLPRPGDVW